MPTHVKAQIAMAYDSLLPRDLVVMDPCFRWDNLTIQDAESLANNIHDAIEAAWTGSLPQTTIKIYDLEGSVPVLPMATVERRTGTTIASQCPREVSVCLSFAGGEFQPRQRGRIYPPATITDANGVRPSSGARATILALGQQLHDVGGANVDWIVWSRVNQSATAVTKCWVDDEWDTQRRRGLRSTTRDEINF